MKRKRNGQSVMNVVATCIMMVKLGNVWSVGEFLSQSKSLEEELKQQAKSKEWIDVERTLDSHKWLKLSEVLKLLRVRTEKIPNILEKYICKLCGKFDAIKAGKQNQCAITRDLGKCPYQLCLSEVLAELTTSSSEAIK